MHSHIKASAFGCLSLLATSLAACRPPLPGAISTGGYTSARYALQVRPSHDAPSAAGLMPEGWKLDNFFDGDPKGGNAYQTFVILDRDGNGDPDWKRAEPAFELRFVHQRHAGVVWLRTVPVAQELAQTDLHVLTMAYLDALAGGEYERSEPVPERVKVVEKRFASTLLSAEPCHLAAQECEIATIEIADVDQLKLDPNYRSHKVEIVITRTSFAYRPGGRGRGYPVYLVAGYSNQPLQFDAGLKDFAEFLQHIEITGHRGFQGAPTTALAASSSVGAPTPAPILAPAAAPVAKPVAAPAMSAAEP